MLNACYRRLLLQAGAAVATRRAIDLQEAAIRIVGNLGTSHGGGQAGNLQNISGLRTNSLQVSRSQTTDSVTEVFDACFGNAKGEGSEWGRWSTGLVVMCRGNRSRRRLR